MPIPLFLKNAVRIRIVLSFSILLVLIVFAFIAFPSGSRANRKLSSQEPAVARKRTRPAFVPGDVLVRYRSETLAANKTRSATIQTKEGLALPVQVVRFGGSDLVEGLRLAHVPAEDTLKAVDALRNDPEVLYAEPNYILRTDLAPNDPRYPTDLYGLGKIGAPQAWNTTQGSSTVVVGVIDQGIDIVHHDLQANVWTNPAPGSIPGITGDLHGFNFVNNNGTIFSGNLSETHASHVAGIIGAVGNNATGVVGVNWTVGLMSLKFLDASGSGDTADAISAVNYARQMRALWVSSGHTQGANIRVLNNSYGGAGFTQAFLDAITNVPEILFVAAAGNKDIGTEEPNNDVVPHYPSSFDAPNVIAVAATDSSDTLSSSFSHFGATSVDLGAPGSSILSTTPPCPVGTATNICDPERAFTDANGDTYSIFSGTSMSTPHVSGAAALLWAQNPNLTVQQVKNLLLVNGDVLVPLIDKTVTGRRLNVGNSFQSLAENDTTPPGTVSGFHINTQNGRSLSLGWTASGDDGATGKASLYELSFTDSTSGAVILLKGLLPGDPGTGQIADVRIPYQHISGTISLREFDNAGNEGVPATLSVGVPLSLADPYTTSVGSAVALSPGGTRLNINADDQYQDFTLPVGFTFPFFGTNVTEVHLSTNGNIYFSQPLRRPPPPSPGDADDVPSARFSLSGFKMIAGLWDDLDLRDSSRADAGIYVVQPSPSQIIFRWQGVPCNDNGSGCTGGAPVNFEIELRTDGTIKSRYGSGNTGLVPIVGIGGGDPDGYVISSLSSDETPKDLTNAGEVTYTPRAQTVSTLQLSPPFSVPENGGTFNVTVTRTGDTSSVATVDYATSDTAGANNCNVVNGAASSRCDYLTTLGTLHFAAGDTSKTISIPIIDDIRMEGDESFTITLSNATGATLGAPATATLTINDNDSGSVTTNPIDTAGFFVRQHYVDFLNREPDTSGLAFWTNELTQCGSNQACIDLHRVNVSAAFYLSIEFQQTGYLVERMYKTAYADATGTSTLGGSHTLSVPVVRFNEFLGDTQAIGQGVVVGQTGWEQVLENNKQAFALAFVQRPRFLTAFPGTLSPDQFVTQFATNAGVTLSAGDKANLVAVLGLTPSDLSKRAEVLRLVSENPDLRTAESNKAFVLMQFFGYLRRNPDDPQDSDYTGYDFWLTKLNQFNGNFVDAEMVKAFITSIEYKQRFAP